MVPERDGHIIEIQWPTVAEQLNYRVAPSHYVSFLLGHEGEGSAFALLKAKGWATALVAGEASTSFSSRSFFMCQIELTEEGQRHVEEVVAVIFAYLQLLRGPEGVQERIWREMEALARLRFDYRDKLNPYSYVTSLSNGMQLYRPEDLLLAVYSVPLQYDPELIAQVIADLTPENARVMWASKALAEECTVREEWYGTAYAISKIPEGWMREWKAAQPPADGTLHLPVPNEFVPSDFSLVATSAEAPTSIDSSAGRLWLRPEPTFKVPKAAFYLHFHLPEAYCTVWAAVLTKLYVKLVNDALSEVTYPADVAGLGYSLRATVPGVLLTLHGYHHTLPKLANVVVDAFVSCQVRDDRFAVAAEKLQKDFANMAYQQPYQLALYDIEVALESPRWHIGDYEEVLPKVTAEHLRAFVPRLLARCRMEAFSAGNLPEDAAKALVASAEAQLQKRCGTTPLFPSEDVALRVVKLPAGRPVLLRRTGPNPANDNSAVTVVYQVGPDDPATNALAELLVHIGRRDAFYQLRTVEQLGYLTFFTSHSLQTVSTVAFIIQSSAKTAAYLESRVEAFLPQLQHRLASMPEEEFTTHVEELAKSKLEKPKRLREVAAKDWREIDDGTLRFKRQEDEVAEVRKLTPGDLLAFFDEKVCNRATRRKLSVHIQAGSGDGGAAAAGGVTSNGDATSEENGAGKEAAAAGAGDETPEVVRDAFAWKRRQELYPSAR